MRTDIAVRPTTKNRKDYTVDMGFDLDPAATQIATRIAMRRNPVSASKEVVLFGEELELLQLHLNGKQLKSSQYITGRRQTKHPIGAGQGRAGDRNPDPVEE